MLSLLAALALAAPVPDPGPEWVTVKGSVVWPANKAVPEAKAYPVPPKMRDAEYAGKGGPLVRELFQVDETTRGLKNVVVWLRPDDDDPKAVFPEKRIHPDLAKPKPTTHHLATEFCRYDKPMLAVRAGDAIAVTNKSPVACAFRFNSDGFDCLKVLKPNDKPFVTDALTTPGIGSFDDCVHPWPGKEERIYDGRVRVFDHPYFAVTDEKGEFEIKQVPRGKWRVMYQHESGYHKGKGGRLGFPVEVKAGKDATMTMKPVGFEPPK